MTPTEPKQPNSEAESAPQPSARCRLVLPHYQSFPTLKRYLPQLLRSLEHHGVPVEVLVVDDGSARLMQKLISTWSSRLSQDYDSLLPVQLLDRNCGKGYAIRQGWASVPDSVDVLAFVDADGSVPAEAVATQLLVALEHPDILHCGIRPAPSRATRSIKRRIMAACFAAYARRVLGIQVSDPQCGFKMVPKAIFQRLQRRFKVNRFAFDCELLAHAATTGVAIREVELPWVESPTSTVRSIRDGWQMVRDLRKIRRELRIWQRLQSHPGTFR